MRGTPLKVRMRQDAGGDPWALIVDRVARRHMDFNQVGGRTWGWVSATRRVFGTLVPQAPREVPRIQRLSCWVPAHQTP